MSGSTSSNAAGATGSFRTENGRILDPAGNAFMARGINMSPASMDAADQVLAGFPGLNFIRLTILKFEPPEAYATFIDKMTSHGVVVELEDHMASDGSDHGGSSGAAFTGEQLANESNWYSSVARAYASNPFVWFGTDNEPPNEGLSPWQQQTYNAIRSTGNNNPVLVSMPGGGWIGPQNVESYGMDPNVYAAMTNIIMDVHLYGWSSAYTPDQQAVDTALTNLVNGAQTVPSANGIVPVILGEFGISTDAQTMDANADQVLRAAQNSMVTHGTSGAVAFAWAGGNLDSLTDDQGNFTPYGQGVANWIAHPPLPPAVNATDTNPVVTQGTISAVAVSDAGMSFVSGSEDAAGPSAETDGGISDPSAADDGSVPSAGDILNTGDTLDLTPALTAMDWDNAASALPGDPTVTGPADDTLVSTAAGLGGPETATASMNALNLTADPAAFHVG